MRYISSLFCLGSARIWISSDIVTPSYRRVKNGYGWEGVLGGPRPSIAIDATFSFLGVWGKTPRSSSGYPLAMLAFAFAFAFAFAPFVHRPSARRWPEGNFYACGLRKSLRSLSLMVRPRVYGIATSICSGLRPSAIPRATRTLLEPFSLSDDW